MASARQEQRPGARQRGASGAKVFETWESREVLGGCWACGSFNKSLFEMAPHQLEQRFNLTEVLGRAGLNFPLCCYQ